MDNQVTENFLQILNKVADFRQSAKLTYPDVDGYKNALKLVVGVLTKGNKGISVYADYDCDGLNSGVMLHRFLQNAVKIIRGDEMVGMIKLKYSNRQNSFGITEQEFREYRRDSDIVITVDNGSSVSFLNHSLEGQLIVLDHHFSKNQYPFVLNPNTGRTEGVDDYSTSGGRIVYDFIKNLDGILKGYIPEYKAIDNFTQLETLRELASITLISDMAIMDATNREFVIECLNTIRANPNKLPIYSKLKKFSTRELSFEIISQINAMSRMEKDLSVVSSWIAPKTMEEWKEADLAIETNNTNKKLEVSKAFSKYLEKKANSENECLIEFLFLPKSPIGILGLLANRISNKEGNKPTIVAGIKANGDISMSARGENVRGILGGILEKGQFGGHQNACGGKIIIQDGEQIEDAISALEDRISLYEDNHREELSIGGKVEVINQAPLTVSEFKSLCLLYESESNGVAFYKDICATVSDFTVLAEHVFQSGWTKVSLGDSAGSSIEFMFNGEEISLSQLKQKDTVAIMEFTPEDSYAIHSILPKSQLENKTKIISESEELRVFVKNAVQDEIVSDIAQIYYYCHPESSCAWSAIRREEDYGDGLVEEIDLETFNRFKREGWSITEHEAEENKNTESTEPLIPTEMNSVFLVKTLTTELVLAHPEYLFVFGDNIIKRGKGGQAVIRDCPNAFGIPTKKMPTNDADAFFSDIPSEHSAVIVAINELHKQMKNGKKIVFPYDGIGNGLAKLQEKAPTTLKIINQLIGDHFTKHYLALGSQVPAIAKKDEIKKQYNTKTEKIAP